MQCKPVFDLGFTLPLDDDNNDTVSSVSHQQTSAPLPKKIHNMRNQSLSNHLESTIIPEMKCKWNHWLTKTFAPETEKKIHWVTNMYHQRQINRNTKPDFIHIFADLDSIASLNKTSLSHGLCHFITEIKKLNGEDFPPKTINEIVVCIQMYLDGESNFWKLLDEKKRNLSSYATPIIILWKNVQVVG